MISPRPVDGSPGQLSTPQTLSKEEEEPFITEHKRESTQGSADREAPAQASGTQKAGTQETRIDAIRHVGPTLEAEGVFLPGDELPENRIAAEGLVENTLNVRAVTADPYDREAEAMGAEPLRTRLPGDTSSDPHTNVGPDNATTLDGTREDKSGSTGKGKKGRAA